MKQYFVLLFACMALWGCGGQDQIETPPLKIIDQIDFSHVHIRDNFWSPRLAKHTSAPCLYRPNREPNRKNAKF
jgi:hypothetical protein